MLAAFAEAAAVLDNNEYLEIARRNADFAIESLERDGRLLRTWKDGKAKLNAYIEDYANFTDGLIELFQASGEAKYLNEAKRLADVMIDEFWDEENGGFYFTSTDHEELIVRNKDFFDNATPSGNSVAADVFLKLFKFFGDEKYERFGATVLRLVSPQIARYPNGFGRALSVMEFYLADSSEIVIVGQKGNELEKALWEHYVPNRIVLLIENEEARPVLALAEGRKMIEGKPTAYVCRNFVCNRPVNSITELMEQL
jgi:uncharacterized protein YyaL (SSP411 family)